MASPRIGSVVAYRQSDGEVVCALVSGVHPQRGARDGLPPRLDLLYVRTVGGRGVTAAAADVPALSEPAPWSPVGGDWWAPDPPDRSPFTRAPPGQRTMPVTDRHVP